MITGMNHTGFVVADLDRSVDFYNEVVGLQVVARRERDGGPISQVLDYEKTSIKVALLGIDGEDGHILELLEYVNPVSTERPTNERAVLGASHLAFNVTDIARTGRPPYGDNGQVGWTHGGRQVFHCGGPDHRPTGRADTLGSTHLSRQRVG